MQGLAPGSDGNVWFTEQQNKKVAQITPAGAVTEFALPSGATPGSLALGPDGNVWYTADTSSDLVVGRVTPAGTITEFAVAGTCCARGIVAGPDGAIWFTAGSGHAGKITTSGAVTLYPVGSPINAGGDIVVGSDGNLWFTKFSDGIYRITPTGILTQFPYPLALGIASGPDGNIWFSQGGANGGTVGRITTGGTALGGVTIPDTNAISALGLGPDGAVWLNADKPGTLENRLVRVNPDLSSYDFLIPRPASAVTRNVRRITAGPDGNLWFTTLTSQQIGRLSLPLATRTTVTATSPLPAKDNQTVTLAASVEAPFTTGTPTGTVQFLDGANAVGAPVALTSGMATLTVGPLPRGRHEISARYSGDATFPANVATPYTLFVQEVLVLNALPAVAGTMPLSVSLFNLTATIDSPTSPIVPSVNVQMRDAVGNLLCTAVNPGGTTGHSASCSVLLTPAKLLAVVLGGGYTATIVPTLYVAEVVAHGGIIGP